jgi:hypothetical protein
MKINWKIILRAIAIISLIVAILWLWFQPGFEPLYTLIVTVASIIGSFLVPEGNENYSHKLIDVNLFDDNCGNKSIDIGNQRLQVSSAFGSYFLGLLEREQIYVPLSGQIDCPPNRGQENLSPLQRVLWSLQNPKGSQIIIVAADGGMGKSTLASKLVRCLYEQEVISLILGDSAKNEMVDPSTGKIILHEPGYQTHSSFCKRLCLQLGVQYENDNTSVMDIRRRLVGRRAIIVVDNLESVSQGDLLLKTLLQITNHDIKAIVTTRQVNNLLPYNNQILLVRLNPIQSLEVTSKFVQWHIDQYKNAHPNLTKVLSSISDKKNLRWLLEKSGGVPLLIQLIISDVARSSWEQINLLPSVFGVDLLNFLYKTRWLELSQLSTAGLLAQEILLLIYQEQNNNRKITSKSLIDWTQARGRFNDLSDALILLHERFLIINSDNQKGNFSIFPSLAEFLHNQQRVTI